VKESAESSLNCTPGAIPMISLTLPLRLGKLSIISLSIINVPVVGDILSAATRTSGNVTALVADMGIPCAGLLFAKRICGMNSVTMKIIDLITKRSFFIVAASIQIKVIKKRFNRALMKIPMILALKRYQAQEGDFSLFAIAVSG